MITVINFALVQMGLGVQSSQGEQVVYFRTNRVFCASLGEKYFSLDKIAQKSHALFLFDHVNFLHLS